MSIAGGHHKAVAAAVAAGCDALQVFTKNTNQWAAKPLTAEEVAAFREASAGARLGALVAHNSYLINLGSPDDALWERSIQAMVVEVERAEALGIFELVFHPGSHTGAGEEAGIERVAAGVQAVLARTAGSAVWLDLESTAGQGNSLGCRLGQIGAILQRVGRPERLGVCLDTCHLFAAGYDFGSKSAYDTMMDELEDVVGVERVRVWHLNDSVKGLGSRVDRHAGIGRGRIGLEAFGHIVRDGRFREVPMVLETPKGEEDGRDLDVINLELLRGLVSGSGRGRRVRSRSAGAGEGGADVA
jgi:deoxyribonuclease-4